MHIANHIPIRAALVAVLFLLGTFAIPAGSVGADEYSLQQHFLGEVIHDQFGFACAGAGDVNGDGFDDFLVGANVNDEHVLSGGKMYLYLGAAEYPSVHTLSLGGHNEREYLGASFAAGDLNGDGFDDWVVGAPGLGSDGQAAGRVYLFLGGAEPDAEPDLLLSGVAPAGQFGQALCVIPSLNGDEYADLAVGAPRDGDGRVYIFLGGPGLPDDICDLVLEARPEDSRFGGALAALPDINNDACDELLVGVPRCSEAAAWAGAALLFEGGDVMDDVADLVFLGESAGDEFGSALACEQDLNGDGESDILIGAPAANAGGQLDAGKAYLFFAGSLLDVFADLVFSGDANEGRLGASVAGGFDWDGDGASDLALGVPNDDAGGQDAGACLIFRGGAALDNLADWTLQGPASGSHLGKSLAPGGDLRHNGRMTLLVGGYNEVDAGRLQLFGSDNGPTAVTEGQISPVLDMRAPWPNPANPMTNISFIISRDGPAELTIHDLMGRKLALLHSGSLAAGRHEFTWRGLDFRGRELPSGVYLARLTANSRTRSAKITLVR